MEWERAAESFSAMGSESRLQVLKTLVRAGDAGLSVGDIQQRTEIAPSTLSHHLKFLAAGGVITQMKTGRSIRCVANFDYLHQLSQFIESECCADVPKKAANDG